MPARLITQTLLLAGLLSSMLAGAEQLAAGSVVGKAYDRGTGYFVYSEHHICGEDRQLCTVQYRDSFGVIFAKKDLDYRHNPITPSLVMTDYRRGEEVRVPAMGQDNLVVDAGFDNYIRSIWEVLDAGDKAKFPFLIAGFDKPIKMMALRSKDDDCTATELCLEINLDSWLLGKFIAPIELSYSRAERRLLRFSGLSNIKDVNGGSLHVDIHYQYDEELVFLPPQGQQKSTHFSF